MWQHRSKSQLLLLLYFAIVAVAGIVVVVVVVVVVVRCVVTLLVTFCVPIVGGKQCQPSHIFVKISVAVVIEFGGSSYNVW